MGHLAPGFRKTPQGRIESRMFDIDDLNFGEAHRNGWVDAPEKVPGGALAQQRADEEKRSTAHTISPEPRPAPEPPGRKGKRK